VCCQNVGERRANELMSVGGVDFEEVITERQIGTCELDRIGRQIRHTAV